MLADCIEPCSIGRSVVSWTNTHRIEAVLGVKSACRVSIAHFEEYPCDTVRARFGDEAGQKQVAKTTAAIFRGDSEQEQLFFVKNAA